MAWSPWMSSLNDVLADLFPSREESQRIVDCAGLEKQKRFMAFNDASLINWYNILSVVNRGAGEGTPAKALAILDCALADFPDHKILLALKAGEPPVVKGPDLKWEAPADAQHLEKIIGAQSTLLQIRFLEIGMLRARAVARIVRADGSSGTGFLIGGGWLLTNNHVLPSTEIIQGAEAQFNYQKTKDDLDAAMTPFALDATRFATSKDNDWTVAGIDPKAEADWGTIALEPVTTAVDAFVNIIQHPGGGPKQIGLYHNTVTFVGEGRVQYLTDTLPGSSGSPVFDADWRCVALHHSSVALRDPATKAPSYRNEGIAITTVIHDLDAAGVRRDR